MAGDDDESGNDRIEIDEIDLAGARASMGAMSYAVAGLDLPMFQNYWMRALAGDTGVPATIAAMAMKTRGDVENAEKRSDKEWERLFWQCVVGERLREIDRLIGRYNEMADWHHGQAELARGRMREASDKLAEIEQFVSGVNDLLKGKERTGKFDREKAIELLKTRGVEVDPSEDDAVILARLLSEQRKASEEKRKWTRQYDDASGAADYHDEQERENRRKAQELVDKREAVRKGGYDAEEEARRLTKITEEYEADIRRKAFEIEKLKNGVGGGRELITCAQKGINKFKDQDEQTDFLASMDALTEKFATAAANVVRDDPKQPSTMPQTPSPAGPVSSA